MILRGASALVIAGAAAVACGSIVAGASGNSERLAEPRAFSITYAVKIDEIPSGSQRLQVWMPVPQSDRFQSVTALKIESPIPHRFVRDPDYGNLILAFDETSPLPTNVPILVEATIERRPNLRAFDRARSGSSSSFSTSGEPGSRDLAPDRLVPLGGKIGAIAREVTAGRKGELEKARAIYDYVTRSMRYDKLGHGWGQGDALRACDVRTGNCTDFHALFIGLCRSASIPARFEMGFSLPEGESQGPIPGYHCWAEFFVPGTGWVPVDCSEASKRSDRLEFYFGSLDPNRVQFTVGRDISIGGAGDDSPANYLIYPIVRVDGVRHEAVVREVSFVDDPS